MADVGLALHKFLPKVVVVAQQFERRGQTEIMTVVGQQFHAKGVDRAEEGAIECSLHLRSQFRLEKDLPRALLHFVRRAICESDDDQARQNFRRVDRTRDRQNALRDSSGLPRTGRCYDRKISIQFVGKSRASRFVTQPHHISHSSFSSTSAGWVSAHLSSKMSLSICNVASGYGAL